MNRSWGTGFTVVLLLLLSILAAASPIQAHFTLGDLTGTYRYRVNDFDPHVPGVIGYVWPGGGQNAYSGFPAQASANLSPGYQSPYPGQNPPGAPSSSWHQLEGDAYAPFGAVLSGSKGDLIFAINSTQTDVPFGWDAWIILIPPGFKVPSESSQIVSTLTNNYVNIYVTQLSPYDRYAPNWTLVSIKVDASINAGYNHQTITFTSAKEWYYARVNGVTAPSTAGRYFFKMWLAASYQPKMWVPPENWPVLLVKAEIDPAIITGTIRYAGFNQTLYSQPVQEAGRVYAKMTTRLDPYTGQARPDLPLVDAVSYFNATAKGHFEVEGLAPGVYDLYASAAGYPQTLVESGFTVLKGQSLHFDGYLQPGAVIHANVFTKHQFGDEPWPENTYVKIELYDSPTLNHVPDSSARMVSWSPFPCVAGGQERYSGDSGHAAGCGDPRDGSAIAFPWHEYTPATGYSATVPGGYPFPPVAFGDFYQVSTDNGNNLNAAGVKTQDPMGVGPPQNWYVLGQTTTPFHFQFGVKGEYGAPRDLDGMVPQIYATWVNGLTPGRYYARAWVFRYVQSALDGSTFQEYSFDVTPNEWAGDVSLPMDLRLSSWVNKTVHYHITAAPDDRTDEPIDTGAGYLYGTLQADSGVIYSYNVTALGKEGLYGFSGGGGYLYAPPFFGGENLDPAGINANAIENGLAVIQFWGMNDTWGGQNYGIPSGTYTDHVASEGYVEETTHQKVSVTLSGSPTAVSDHLFRGAGFKMTVYSIDWEQPIVSRPWVWGNDQAGVSGPSGTGRGSEIDVGFFSNGRLFSYLSDTIGDLPVTITSSHLFQGLGGLPCPGEVSLPALSRTCTMMDGGGRNIKSDENANLAYFGVEGGDQWVGGSTGGTFIFLTQGNFVPYLPMPTAFPTGTYDLRTVTYGYIQTENETVSVQDGQYADLRINMVVGVNVTLDVLFKKEHVITGTAGNMSVRVRLYDDSGALVATWMSSEGTYATRNGFSRAADGTPPYPFTVRYIQTTPGRGLQSYNFLPGGTTALHVLMAGLPQQPSINGYFGDPIFTPWSCSFEITCYRGAYGRWEPIGQTVYPFANSGIPGAPNYLGGWTAEVDFVNWYANNSGLTPNYYPPVPGLLMGESYHIIPGTTAKSNISLTEDAATSSVFIGHSLAPNHLGPYSQQGVWQISNAHDSGEASGIFEVDLNGFVSGNVLAFTWSNEFRPLSWSQLSVTGATGASWNFYTYDGIYEAYAPPGRYQFTISSQGYSPQTWSVAISPGQSGLGQDVYLEQSNLPSSEQNGPATVRLMASSSALINPPYKLTPLPAAFVVDGKSPLSFAGGGSAVQVPGGLTAGSHTINATIPGYTCIGLDVMYYDTAGTWHSIPGLTGLVNNGAAFTLPATTTLARFQGYLIIAIGTTNSTTTTSNSTGTSTVPTGQSTPRSIQRLVNPERVLGTEHPSRLQV